VSSAWYFLSDLHLDDRPGPGDAAAHALPGFLDALTGSDEPTHLVLLGDTFELALVPGDPVPRLDRIARRHPAVVLALRRCLAAGVQVHVVVGNHDIGLVRVAERARLARLLGSTNLHVHPWCLYVPGLFYAEHGHQHHDLNRSPRMVAAGELPPTPLAAWAGGAHGPLPVLRALSAATSEERRSRHTDHLDALHAVADRAGLPTGSARALHEVSRLRPGRTTVRLARRAAARARGRDDHDDYLRRAAVRIAEVLDRYGAAPPYYVFGHTHTPVVRGLPHTQSLYANPGSWTAVGDGSGLPYLLLTDDGRGAALRLLHHHPRRQPVARPQDPRDDRSGRRCAAEVT
jgi:UDP-2,3-diacylglucosamine pyrophosphatase LpxH